MSGRPGMKEKRGLAEGVKRASRWEREELGGGEG